MEYPSLQGKLILPEYGRNVQKMIEYATKIEDKEERMKCVNSIVETMGNLFPYLRDVHDFKHILWDHIAIMSDFKLDIDYPFEIVKKEELYKRPDLIPYKNSDFKYKHYGQNLESMIQKATEFEEGDEKNEFIRLIANQMKKCFLMWNKEAVDDRKILDDLRELSNGKLDIADDFFTLVETKDVLKKPVRRTNTNTTKRKRVVRK